MELRDERISFFVRALTFGKHRVAYCFWVEIPRRFRTLSTRAYSMYAFEPKVNSDESKLWIPDCPTLWELVPPPSPAWYRRVPSTSFRLKKRKEEGPHR